MTDILKFTEDYPELKEYLPTDEKDFVRLTRGWLVNIVNSVITDEFSEWVRKVITDRNDKLSKKRNLHLEMDNQIA